MSELEFGLILAGHAFHRWMGRCIAAAGQPGLSSMEVLVLHTVRHRDRPKRLAEILLVLGIEDTHVVTYALRKLQDAGLVSTGRAGKEKLVQITPEGIALCTRYHQVREALLIAALGTDEATLSGAAAALRALSGTYDQAARAAATL